MHPILTEAARAHSKEMLAKDYFAHDSFNGESIEERLERLGYTFDGYSYHAYGENIAWDCDSYRTPESRFKSWMHSPDHKANILDKRFREVGIGVLTGTQELHPGRDYTVGRATLASVPCDSLLGRSSLPGGLLRESLTIKPGEPATSGIFYQLT